MHRTGVCRWDSTDCGTLVSPSGNIILTRCGNKTQFAWWKKMSPQMIVSLCCTEPFLHFQVQICPWVCWGMRMELRGQGSGDHLVHPFVNHLKMPESESSVKNQIWLLSVLKEVVKWRCKQGCFEPTGGAGAWRRMHQLWVKTLREQWLMDVQVPPKLFPTYFWQ